MLYNVELSVQGDILTIKIDLTENSGAGARNIIVASTGNDIQIPGTDVRLKVFAYKPLPYKFLK
jgi:hypothetical protein